VRKTHFAHLQSLVVFCPWTQTRLNGCKLRCTRRLQASWNPLSVPSLQPQTCNHMLSLSPCSHSCSLYVRALAYTHTDAACVND